MDERLYIFGEKWRSLSGNRSLWLIFFNDRKSLIIKHSAMIISRDLQLFRNIGFGDDFCLQACVPCGFCHNQEIT